MDERPFRSVLYIPAAKARALEKARQLAADAIIFDLEDAVGVGEKSQARALLAPTLAAGGYGARAQLVRINALDTPWGSEDVAALAQAAPEAVLLPKVNAAADVEALARLLDARPALADTRIWAMMETPAGILNAAQIAAAPRMAGFVMGTNDLAKDLGASPGPGRMPFLASLQICLLAARAHGLVAVDGVFNAIRDTDGLRAECQQGREMGFDGKTVIHPDQIAVANAVFAPSADELDLCRRQITAWQEASDRGEAVAVVDGKIVENLHVEMARRQLARAEAIERAGKERAA